MLRNILLALAVTTAGFAHAQTAPVAVEGAWVRATVQGQMASGAFMRLTAREHLALVGVETPLAGTADVHEMKMEGDVMRMRALPALDLPAGRAVDLKPGGFHVMLQQLKAPLAPGSKVPLTLLLRNDQGAVQRLALSVPVLVRPPESQHQHK